MKLCIDSHLVHLFYLDYWCSHSCLQEGSAQYHPEESPRLPVSYTLLNSDPLWCRHAVSLFFLETHVRQMSFLTCLGLSFSPLAVIPGTSTRPFSPSCSSTRWGFHSAWLERIKQWKRHTFTTVCLVFRPRPSMTIQPPRWRRCSSSSQLCQTFPG